MEPEENVGANSDEGQITPEATPAVETSSDGLIGTVDLPIPDQSEPQQLNGEPEGGENERYDKIPRFQEITKQRDEALASVGSLENKVANMEGQISVFLKGGSQPPVEQGETQLPFKNVAEMSDDEILEWQADNPKEFYSNVLLQAKHELSQDFNNTLTVKDRETAIDASFNDYGEKNPDFWDKWNNGEIQNFMKENPAHNAISAHQILTQGDRETEIRKETESKLLKQLKIKGSINSLGPSGTFTPESAANSDALKNPDKHGGVTNVLLQRHMARVAS